MGSPQDRIWSINQRQQRELAELLQKYRNTSDESARYFLVYAVGRYSHPDVFSFLRAAAVDPSLRIRYEVIGETNKVDYTLNEKYRSVGLDTPKEEELNVARGARTVYSVMLNDPEIRIRVMAEGKIRSVDRTIRILEGGDY